MPTRPLPDDPSLEHLKKEAKQLRNAMRAGDPAALATVAEHHPRADRSTRFSLADAQLVTARRYGFASWTRLKQHLAAIEPFVFNPPPRDERRPLADVFIGFACLDYGAWHCSNPDKAWRLLDDHPELAEATLYTAAAAGNVAAVRTFIERDPGLVNRPGGPLRWEPLLYTCYSRMTNVAAGYSTLDVARVLLEHGANPNAGFLYSGTYLFTALTGAFGEGEDGPNNPPHPDRDALAQLLLDAGADPNDGQTLYNRHFRADDDHLRLLFAYGLGQDKGSPWLARLGPRAMRPSRLLVEELWSAVKNHFPARVKLLVERGVDVNTPGLRNGRTPYEQALLSDSHEIADYLAAHGAKRIPLEPRDVFALACIAGDRSKVRAMLDDDPTLVEELNHRSRVDLIHRAASAESFEGVRLVVELGIDVNGMVPGTGLDRSALHNAAMSGTLEMVTLLLELGADPQLRDPTYHSTAIGWADHVNRRHVVDYLARFASVFDALRCDAVERVAELLETDPALANALDDKGTPLVFYLHPQMRRLEDTLAVLQSHGADLNVQPRGGGTILDVANAKGLVDFAAVLRRHGARTSEELGATR